MIKTRTRTYLMPSLVKLLKLDRSNCIDLYLGIKGETKELDGTVYLKVHVLDPSLTSSRFYIEHKTYDDNILVRFKYPYPQDYSNFVDGLYSKMSEECKQNILQYYNLTIQDKIYKILYKHPSLKAVMEKELGVSLKNYELGEKINKYDELFVPGS